MVESSKGQVSDVVAYSLVGLPLGPELPVFWSEQKVNASPSAAVRLKRNNKAVACINLTERLRLVLNTFIVECKK
jgi:hypothetical protein